MIHTHFYITPSPTVFNACYCVVKRVTCCVHAPLYVCFCVVCVAVLPCFCVITVCLLLCANVHYHWELIMLPKMLSITQSKLLIQKYVLEFACQVAQSGRAFFAAGSRDFCRRSKIVFSCSKSLDSCLFFGFWAWGRGGEGRGREE